MNTPAKTTAHPTPSTIEDVLIRGDLKDLTPQQRVEYVARVCQSLGLNPLTRPFEFLTLSGKLTLYAKRDATDQLRKLNNISVEIVGREQADGLLIVHARAHDKDGRTDEDFGAVAFKSGGGEIAANLLMKCTTKAKRRVTLSICGLGFLDETEVPGVAPELDAPGESVSFEQCEQLTKLVDTLGVDLPRFLAFLGERLQLTLPTLAHLPVEYFEFAKAQLERKRTIKDAEQLAATDPVTGEVAQ